jgi:two-component system, NarL family, sensor histidine kinase DesK
LSNPKIITRARRGLPVIPWLLVPLLGLFFLVYPILLLMESDPPPERILVALGGTAIFAGVFLWLMWTRKPLQLGPAEPSEVLEVRVAIDFLVVLAGGLSLALGAEWRVLFFYHVNVAAGIMLPKRDAYAVISGIAILTLVLGSATGFAWLAVPALAIGLWSTTFVSQVAAVAQLSAPARNYDDVFGALKPPQLQTKFAGEAWRAGHRGRRA